MNIFQLTNFYDELVVEVKKNMKKREKKSISYFKKWNSAFLTFLNNNVDNFKTFSQLKNKHFVVLSLVLTSISSMLYFTLEHIFIGSFLSGCPIKLFTSVVRCIIKRAKVTAQRMKNFGTTQDYLYPI